MRKRVISLSLLAVILGVMIWTFYINWPKNNEKQTETILTSTEFLKMNKTGENPTDYVEQTEQPIQDENENSNSSHKHELGDEQALGGEAHEEIIVDEDHTGHDHEMNESEVLNINSAAKDFQLKTLDGKTVQLSDLKGKKVLLNFWATWCPPCREEMPELQKYYEESAEKNNVVLLGVNITDQEFGIKTVREFIDYYGLTFPIILDKTGDVSIDYEILSIPTTFIIDEQGMIIQQIKGPVNLEMLHQLLGE
ncbi:TlpA disulfide reductase family protein [Ureibacillus sp. NPDC094379]